MNALEQEVRAEIESWLRWRRWFLLGVGLINPVAVWIIAPSGSKWSKPLVFIAFLFGSKYSIEALGNWRGELHARVLLALLEEHWKEKDAA